MWRTGSLFRSRRTGNRSSARRKLWRIAAKRQLNSCGEEAHAPSAGVWIGESRGAMKIRGAVEMAALGWQYPEIPYEIESNGVSAAKCWQYLSSMALQLAAIWPLFEISSYEKLGGNEISMVIMKA